MSIFPSEPMWTRGCKLRLGATPQIGAFGMPALHVHMSLLESRSSSTGCFTQPTAMNPSDEYTAMSLKSKTQTRMLRWRTQLQSPLNPVNLPIPVKLGREHILLVPRLTAGQRKCLPHSAQNATKIMTAIHVLVDGRT